MPVYDFTCKACGHTTEKRAGYDVTVVACPFCGELAQKESVYLNIPFTETGVKVGRLMETPLDEVRVNVSRFQEASQEVDYAYSKAEEVVQKPIKRPNFWAEGKKRAKQLQKAGVTPGQFREMIKS